MLKSVTHRGRTFSNIGPDDICLIELLGSGRSLAPRSVTDRLHDKEYVEIRGGKRVLTVRGRRRAEALRHLEPQLRASFTPQTVGTQGGHGCAIRTVGRCSLTA